MNHIQKLYFNTFSIMAMYVLVRVQSTFIIFLCALYMLCIYSNLPVNYWCKNVHVLHYHFHFLCITTCSKFISYQGL
jgi:hypothetical protein